MVEPKSCTDCRDDDESLLDEKLIAQLSCPSATVQVPARWNFAVK